MGISIIAVLLLSLLANADQLAPRREKLTQEEIGTWVGRIGTVPIADKEIVLRGLISDHSTLRADCARYLAHHGRMSDVPYLIDALSDESMHDGEHYSYAGMATTRYWANVALICITKEDLGYRWDDPRDKREQAIRCWTSFWESVRSHQKEIRPLGSER